MSTPLPAGPAFSGASLTQVLPSVANALGLAGFRNELDLPDTRNAVIVMVDGLGAGQLMENRAHAPMLARAIRDGGLRTLQTVAPSTTAAALASFATGLPPALTGMVGYDVLDPDQDKVVNMLGGWDANVDPLSWQTHPTIFEKVQPEIQVSTVSLPHFERSALTRAALRGGDFIGSKSVSARVTHVKTILENRRARHLVYLYWNELDKAGHRYGVRSPEWLRELEELDFNMSRLARSLGDNTSILMTADHGMVDIPAENRLDVSHMDALFRGVRHTGGEPRFLHLYLQPELGTDYAEHLASEWRNEFGDRAWVATQAEAVELGWFGPAGQRPSERVASRIGDVLVAARENIALYDLNRVSLASMEMVGQHGSLTDAELGIPLLRVN